MVCNYKGSEIYLKVIIPPPITSCKRDLKMSDRDITNYQIKAPQQLEMSNWSKTLSNVNLKEA